MKQDSHISPLRAVHDDDLDQLLESLRISRDLAAGRLNCRVCSAPVTRATLLALVPKAGSVSILCTNPACLKQYLRAEEA